MNINLMAPINQLGYGVASLNILKSLSKITNVSLFPIGQPQVTNQFDANIVNKALENAKRFSPEATCIKICLLDAILRRAGKTGASPWNR